MLFNKNRIKANKVYLSIEIATREQRFKRELAKILEKKGFEVELGFTDVIIDGILTGQKPSGILVIKSIQRYNFLKLLLLNLLGVKIIYLEEEAWVPYDDKDLIRRRLPRRTSCLCHVILSPNYYYYKLIKKNIIWKKPKVIFIGSNRMKKKTKPFLINKIPRKILFIGSFGALENRKYFLNAKLNEVGLLKKYFHVRAYKKIFKYWLKDKNLFLDFMKSLLNEGFEISYRPHPKESIKNLPKKINICSNNIPIVDQAKNFDLIIHSGSTCAFEIDTPNVICFSNKQTLINNNSKFYGPIISSLSEFYKIFDSSIGCIYNDLPFVNELKHKKLINELDNMYLFKPLFSVIIFWISKIYLKNLSQIFRDEKLQSDKIKQIEHFEK